MFQAQENALKETEEAEAKLAETVKQISDKQQTEKKTTENK